jgi:hypothetical protein
MPGTKTSGARRRSQDVNGWYVTANGKYLQNAKGDYWINLTKDDLLALRGSAYDLPIHMAEKNWVDMGSFLNAWRAACARKKLTIDPALYETTVQRITAIRGSRRA